jgi:hypothetical protein
MRQCPIVRPDGQRCTHRSEADPLDIGAICKRCSDEITAQLTKRKSPDPPASDDLDESL